MIASAYTIIILFLLFYWGILFWLGRGLTKCAHANQLSSRLPDWPRISVIVSARNEAHNLPRLLHCLQNQAYPAERIEFCIVDDRSSDTSWQILADIQRQNSQFKIFRIDNTLDDYAPKKRALDHAIRAASGELLLLTDADCTPPPGWARSMAQHYQHGVVLVPGYRPYRFDTPMPRLLRGMLALDFFGLAAVAAASIGQGYPTTAAGCNLSYRHDTYFRAGGFEPIRQWVSGDDDLFLLNVAKQKLGRIGYALSPDSFVPCAAPSSWRQFWHQRIRYASKGLHYASPLTFGLSAVYLLNLSLALALPAGMFGFSAYGMFAVMVWIGKVLGEYLFLRKAALLFSEHRLLKYFLPTALIHPFYITLFAFLGSFSQFRWKDEKAPKKQQTETAAHA